MTKLPGIPRDPSMIADAHEQAKIRRQTRLAYRYEDHALSMARKVSRSKRRSIMRDDRALRIANQMLSGRGQ